MTSVNAERKAIVIGGSMGGLLAANMLIRHGWQVDVYERVANELAGRGAGIVTHQELFDPLERAGVEIDDSIGVKVSERVTFDKAGNILCEQRYDQLLTAWSKLFRGLKDAFPQARYHQKKALVRIEQDADSVTAILADGERVTGDLLIGADGIRSTVRAQLLPQAVPQYAGYVGWRGLVEESAFTVESRDTLMERFAFCLPPNEQMVGYPVAGAGDTVARGQRRYNFVWYRPVEEHAELAGMQTDMHGHRHDLGIPPTLIRPEVVAAVRRAAEETLSPAFAEAVHKTDLLFFQPIYDLESSRLVFGRVVLLGDAAFVARPHCGMGVTKAAHDAVVLTEMLESSGRDLQQALADYERQRRQFGHSIVTHARYLGACLQSVRHTETERRMARRYSDPEAVMRETAVSLEYLDLP